MIKIVKHRAISRFLSVLRILERRKTFMSGEGNALLLFEYRFNLFIINIFDATIKFGHDAFDMPFVPGGNIAMKLIILA